MIKRIIKIVVILAVIVVGAGVWLNSKLEINDYKNCVIDSPDQNCPKANVVVVISGGDTKARTLHGIKLLKNGIGQDAIIFSGDTRDQQSISNAEQMRDIALEEGLTLSEIILETEAQNTHENAVKTAKIIEQNEFESMILVTSGYHQLRAYREFRKQIPKEVKIYNAPVKIDQDWSDKWYFSLRGWQLALEEAIAVTILGK